MNRAERPASRCHDTPTRHLIIALLFAFAVVPSLEGAEKTVIGAVEEVILLPSGVRLPARIDTGAATSSLDVQEYTVKGKYVEFCLPERCGGQQLRLPLHSWRHIQSTEGDERRPVVTMDICLGSEKLSTQVTLNDRSKLKYPFLVGRRTLKNKFVVDVTRSRIAPPRCPGDDMP